MTGDVLLVLGSALASGVEMVEAATIVLALGMSRGWRAPLLGSGAALGVLAVATVAVGPALEQIPIDTLRLVVGTLVLLFGLQWLRKAILREAGVLSKHDEDAAFAHEVARARETGRARGPLDRYAWTLSFKSVLLEGLEVVFIVLTLGVNQGSIPLAAAGAVDGGGRRGSGGGARAPTAEPCAGERAQVRSRGDADRVRNVLGRRGRRGGVARRRRSCSSRSSRSRPGGRCSSCASCG